MVFFNQENIEQVIESVDLKSGSPLASFVIVIAMFFLLPLFLMLQGTGLMLWLGLMILVLIKWLKRHDLEVHYVITESSIYKVLSRVDAVEWRVKFTDIISTRFESDGLRVKIPKKTYVVYNLLTSQKLLNIINSKKNP